jgi:hypothetical protein
MKQLKLSTNFETNQMGFFCMYVFGPYRSHFLSRKSLIAAKNETKEERRKEGEETPLVHVNQATAV